MTVSGEIAADTRSAWMIEGNITLIKEWDLPCFVSCLTSNGASTESVGWQRYIITWKLLELKRGEFILERNISVLNNWAVGRAGHWGSTDWSVQKKIMLEGKPPNTNHHEPASVSVIWWHVTYLMDFASQTNPPFTKLWAGPCLTPRTEDYLVPGGKPHYSARSTGRKENMFSRPVANRALLREPRDSRKVALHMNCCPKGGNNTWGRNAYFTNLECFQSPYHLPLINYRLSLNTTSVTGTSLAEEIPAPKEHRI